MADGAAFGLGGGKVPPRPPGRFRDLTDPWDDPEGQAFAREVRDKLIPKLDSSALVMGLISKASTDGAGFDVKQALEIGACLLMGKPLVLGVMAGAHVPDGLARAANDIIEVDLEDAQGTAAKIKEAQARLAERGLLSDDEDET